MSMPVNRSHRHSSRFSLKQGYLEHQQHRSRLLARACRITLGYAFFAALWIYFSDQALTLIFPEPEQLLRWSVYKGIAFVVTTSIILLLLLLKAFRQIDQGYASALNQRAEIERLNAFYSALSHINQMIVHASSRDELLTGACRELVEHAGLRMAWIGWDRQRGAPLSCRASYGEAQSCIAQMLAQDDEQMSGENQWRQVFRQQGVWVSNDVLLDPETSHWRAEARQYGLFAAASLPLKEKDELVGILSVYADERNFFRSRELALLEEVALDMSFALTNFALAEERADAEAEAKRQTVFADTMLESMPGILYFYDESGHFLRWNQNFERVSGYSAMEIAGMHPLDLFPEDERAQVEQRIAEVFTQGESSVEADFLTRDGRRIPYFFTGRLVEYEGKQRLVGVGIDISERKAAETALRELNDNLEHLVEERTTELQAAVQRAEAADQIKSAFLATMSHELRTPLNSIIGFTGIVLQELAGPLNPEQHKQLSMVRDSARHLLALINDVLDLSKIEAGQLEVHAEAIDLRAAITQVTNLVSPLAEKRGLALNVDLPRDLPTMVTDRRRLEQILINLLNNAIKFTEQGSIWLSLSCIPLLAQEDSGEQCGALRFSVRDSGIGIREEELEKLFKPFTQLDSGLTRQHDGTGLGLTICRRLTELMGGKISVSSEWGKGSEFTVLLPLTPQHADILEGELV